MLLTENGHLHGGYTIRAIRETQPEEKKAWFDEYQGIKVYEPLPAEPGV